MIAAAFGGSDESSRGDGPEPGVSLLGNESGISESLALLDAAVGCVSQVSCTHHVIVPMKARVLPLVRSRCVVAEPSGTLHMVSLREHVVGFELFHLEALRQQTAQVACKGYRIAGADEQVAGP